MCRNSKVRYIGGTNERLCSFAPALLSAQAETADGLSNSLALLVGTAHSASRGLARRCNELDVLAPSLLDWQRLQVRESLCVLGRAHSLWPAAAVYDALGVHCRGHPKTSVAIVPLCAPLARPAWRIL